MSTESSANPNKDYRVLSQDEWLVSCLTMQTMLSADIKDKDSRTILTAGDHETYHSRQRRPIVKPETSMMLSRMHGRQAARHEAKENGEDGNYRHNDNKSLQARTTVSFPIGLW